MYSKKANFGYGGGSGGAGGDRNSQIPLGVTGYQNFLANPAEAFVNIEVDEQGIAEF